MFFTFPFFFTSLLLARLSHIFVCFILNLREFGELSYPCVQVCVCVCVFVRLCLRLLVWMLLMSVFVYECLTLTWDSVSVTFYFVCVCVCLAPCALYILGGCPAHPVCMVRLQPNGGGQSKMPGSFLLPPPPPVARPVPLPMPDSKSISTPTDGGLSSPASPCKSPSTNPQYCPSLPTDLSYRPNQFQAPVV